MNGEHPRNPNPKHDRGLLLGGAKRSEVLELWEVQRYGVDSFGDPDYVSIYDLPPAEWHAKGIRLLGRTAVECTRDVLGDAIGKEAAALAATGPPMTGTVALDPFAGSGNTLYWLVRHLQGAMGIGFEADDLVFQLTRRNLAILGAPISVRHVDWREGMAGIDVAPGDFLVAFVAPPWGDALHDTAGLDLRRTSPPITEIVDALLRAFPHNALLCAIQTFEHMNAASLADVDARFDWSMQRVYDLNAPGQNHGVLLGTKGWTP